MFNLFFCFYLSACTVVEVTRKYTFKRDTINSSSAGKSASVEFDLSFCSPLSACGGIEIPNCECTWMHTSAYLAVQTSLSLEWSPLALPPLHQIAPVHTSHRKSLTAIARRSATSAYRAVQAGSRRSCGTVTSLALSRRLQSRDVDLSPPAQHSTHILLPEHCRMIDRLPSLDVDPSTRTQRSTYHSLARHRRIIDRLPSRDMDTKTREHRGVFVQNSQMSLRARPLSHVSLKYCIKFYTQADSICISYDRDNRAFTCVLGMLKRRASPSQPSSGGHTHLNRQGQGVPNSTVKVRASPTQPTRSGRPQLNHQVEGVPNSTVPSSGGRPHLNWEKEECASVCKNVFGMHA